MRNIFKIAIIVFGSMMLNVSISAGENNAQINSKWKKFGTFNDHGEYQVLYNKNGAVLKSIDDVKSDKLYLGKDCDAFSKKHGKGVWSHYPYSTAIWIDFQDGYEYRMNAYGYGIASDWEEGMPMGTNCKNTFVEEEIATTDCSRDPKLENGMKYLRAVEKLESAGWKMIEADWSQNCSGSGLGYCELSAKDCKGRIIEIITIGGYPPESIDSWGISK